MVWKERLYKGVTFLPPPAEDPEEAFVVTEIPDLAELDDPRRFKSPPGLWPTAEPSLLDSLETRWLVEVAAGGEA